MHLRFTTHEYTEYLNFNSFLSEINLYVTNHSRTQVKGCVLILSLFLHFRFAFDYLAIFRIALRPSAGNILIYWLSISVVLPSAALAVYVPFPFDVWGRMWNSIQSVPEHCLFI